MNDPIRPEKRRRARPALLAASAMAVAAFAGPVALAAGHGYRGHDSRAHHPQAKLKHGVLSIKGTAASDTIALRLQARNTGIVQVDVGDDGSADLASHATGSRGSW